MTLDVPIELFEKYDRPGPRYTSYPTAPTWTEEFGPEDYAECLRRAGKSGDPLALYVHLPFCESMCMYCGCSVMITQRREKAPAYVDRVLREAAIVREHFEVGRPVAQHHWGGGTPTFLVPEDLERLFRGLDALWPTTPDAEISIEVDPRVTDRAQLETLRRCGFNRISMGIQDFDPHVQETIHRVQSFEQTRDLIAAARDVGFESVNVDVVYGLPYQRVAPFGATIEQVLQLSPDRIACYSYAHVPWLKKHQRVIPEDALPRGRDKLALYLEAFRRFGDRGYEVIGMDHFAHPDDNLVAAMQRGELHRNFMGYATFPAEDMVAFGMTSISEVAGAFAQNKRDLPSWSADVDAGRLPIDRGLQRSADDDARRRVILDLMCGMRLDYADHGGADAFRQHYASAVASLEASAADGLVSFDDTGITVTPIGRLFVRNLCMPFDAYLERQRAANKNMFSRTV